MRRAALAIAGAYALGLYVDHRATRAFNRHNRDLDDLELRVGRLEAWRVRSPAPGTLAEALERVDDLEAFVELDRRPGMKHGDEAHEAFVAVHERIAARGREVLEDAS